MGSILMTLAHNSKNLPCRHFQSDAISSGLFDGQVLGIKGRGNVDDTAVRGTAFSAPKIQVRRRLHDIE